VKESVPYAPEKQSDGKDAAHRHHAGVCSHGLAGDWMYVTARTARDESNEQDQCRIRGHVVEPWRTSHVERDQAAHYSRLGLFLLPAKLVRQSLTGKD
jgi:hypothetical protein